LLPLADAPLVPPAQPLLRRRPPVAVRIREKVQVVHELPRTISPGGLPVNRSASSAACSSTAAAAWSTTLRAARPRTPPARRPLSAVTVVSLSSYNRTVPSGRRPASRTANLRAASAAGPSRPDSDVGSPTTTSIASCSATSSTSRATSPLPLLTVSRGDARTPPGSQRATPIRTLPTSTPNRTPCLMASLRSAAQGAPAVPASLVARSLLRRSARSSVHPAPRPSQASWLRSAQRLGTPRPPDPPVVYPVVRGSRGPYCVFHRVEGVADRGRVRAAALGEVVLAAPASPEGLGGDPDERAGLQAALARALRDGADHAGPVLRHAGDHDDGGAGHQPAADVDRELAQVVCGGPVGGAVAHERDAADVLGAVGQGSRHGEDLLGAELLQLLLRLAEPGDDPGDPLGQLLLARLHLLGELRHQDALAGQVAEGVDADEGLDAADARADRRLAQHLDQAELPGAGHVGAAAQLAGVVPDLDDADLVAVLLAEQGERPHRARLVERGVEGPDVQVVDQHLVDLVLDVAQHAGGYGARRGEVEPEPAGRVLRAGLRGGLAERPAEPRVDHVGRGV